MNVDIDLSSLTVLIIDESRYARSFVRSALQSFRVGSILEAKDAPAGIGILCDQPIDLVLIERDIIPMDGVEFTRYVRSGQAGNSAVDVPVIMMSGSAEMERVVEARNAGVTEFLVKPISAESLFRRLRHVLVNPRPFVTCQTYVGPCRRTVERQPPTGVERRSNPPLKKPASRIVPPGAVAAAPAAAPSAAVQRAARKRFNAGAIIFAEGERGDEAYVVESGEVMIFKDVDGHRVALGQLGEHGVFGEMALIDDRPRMAGALAVEETVCMVLPKEALKAQIRRSPDLVILVLETLLHNIRALGRGLVEARARLDHKRQRG